MIAHMSQNLERLLWARVLNRDPLGLVLDELVGTIITGTRETDCYKMHARLLKGTNESRGEDRVACKFDPLLPAGFTPTQCFCSSFTIYLSPANFAMKMQQKKTYSLIINL